jgi:hypothetical protein
MDGPSIDGQTVHLQIKEHERHIRLAQTDKSAVAEQSFNLDHTLSYRIPNFLPLKSETWTVSSEKL